MKNPFLKIVVVLISAVIVYGVLMFGFSELGGEVITLIRPEADGSNKNIRVWVVDSDNQSWIEHGDSKTYWIQQLNSDPELSIIREGKEGKFLAFTDREAHDFYHSLRREKYGLSDKVLEMLTFNATTKENCSGIPVRLEKI
ncbi:MAG: hypothetical protein P8J93_05720 [SAR86 cluster bacterium]|jgi:hypothetical protein|nr:hypothetical protein [SAR86 cluster bacterium]